MAQITMRMIIKRVEFVSMCPENNWTGVSHSSGEERNSQMSVLLKSDTIDCYSFTTTVRVLECAGLKPSVTFISD